MANEEVQQPTAETPAPTESAPAGAVEGQVPSETPALEAPPEPIKQKPWYVQRIDRLTAEKYESAARIQELERQLALHGSGSQQVQWEQAQSAQQPTTDEEVNRRAALMAQHIAQQQAFDKQCNAIYDAGMAAHQDFDGTLAVLRNATGGLPTMLIEAAMQTTNPHEVLYALGKDPNKAMEVASLSPVAAAARIARMGAELVAKGSQVKAVSKATPPIAPKVGGVGTTGGIDLADKSIDINTWMEERNKTARRK